MRSRCKRRRTGSAFARPLRHSGTIRPRTLHAARVALVRDAARADALAKMDHSLDALDRFTLEAHTSRDIVVQTDFKLQRNADAELTVDRPDHLVGKVTSERGEYRLYVDDAELTILDTEKNFYAQM